MALLLSARRGWLPPDFSELEYLEKVTSGSYIQTDIYLSGNTEFDCKFSCESKSSAAVFGARKKWIVDMFEPVMDLQNLEMRYGAERIIVGNNSNLPTWELKYIGDYVTANKTNVYINRINFDITVPMCILAVGQPNSAADFGFIGKIYYLRLNTEGEKHNFVPALDNVGAPCMYDTVARKAYYNSGSGDFAYPTERTTFALRRVLPDWGRLTERGLQRLYHAPKDYKGDIADFALTNGFKRIVDTAPPEEGYWTPRWTETDEEIVLEWVETEPPPDFNIIEQDELLTNETTND